MRWLTFLLAAGLFGAEPFHKSELIFAPEKWHNHSSSIVELPDGNLWVVWFHGSGERQNDDVLIQGARRVGGKWTAPFVVADTPGFPDTNCVTWLDKDQRLWLLWPVILANTWESALMKYRISTDYKQTDGPPKWGFADNILLIPPRMYERTKEVMEKDLKGPAPRARWASQMMELSADKLSSRIGWFTRTHPVQLPSGRILVPMYSDGYSFGIMAISDDNGVTWKSSEPIVSYGGIQPSVVRKKSGELVAYMRDNGPPPKRVIRSVSKDDGQTWTAGEDTEIPNPGTSLEAIALKDGRWLMVFNDVEKGRNSLAVALSDDEGATWKWKRNLDKGEGQYHYPSVIQAKDGSIHVTYSVFEAPGKAIRHAQFSAEWVMQ
jgi:predicted neuraminidase